MEKSGHAGARAPALDPYVYIELPVLDSPGTLALARALIDRAQRSPMLASADIQQALRRLVNAESELTLAARRRDDAPSPKELRQPADLAVDTAWTALYERLRAYAILPPEWVTESRRAQELLRTLFPDALAFLRLPYESEWAESENRLRTIEQLRLTADLERLAGAEFLFEVRRTHEHYGKVLGLGRSRDSRPPRPVPGGSEGPLDSESALDSVAMRELRFALARAIAQYALKIVALLDEENELVRRLLAPIEELQELRRHGR